MRSTARRVIGGIWLTLTVLGLAQNAGPEAPPPATLFPPRYGVVNDAELRWLQSDVLPLSLTDRGKLAVSSFRGMPPGFAGFSMDGLDFVNPFRGFWNEQAVPVYQRRPLEPGVSTGRRPFSLMTPDVKRPFSRIVFSQDYIVNLNVVDITYQQRLGPNSLVHLSGGNLVGDGTGGPAFGQFKWNPYRAVARIGWSERWRTEFGYWQLRQRYRFPFITTAFATRRFTDVAHVGWVRLTGRLSERDSLVVLPSFTAMYDKYALENDVLRENRYRMAGVEADVDSRSLGMAGRRCGVGEEATEAKAETRPRMGPGASSRVSHALASCAPIRAMTRRPARNSNSARFRRYFR